MVQEKNPNMEEILDLFVETSKKQNNETNIALWNQQVTLRNQQPSILNIEKQVGLLFKILHEWLPNTLPSNIEVNRRAQVLAVTT